jgi:uncharacterized protein YjbI with pentapeptide repeats
VPIRHPTETENHVMKKSLLAMAALVATSLPVAAHACFGCGVTFNGVSSNGVQLNGAKLNDIKWNGMVLNGFRINGLTWNGVVLNGFVFNGARLNGMKINGWSLNGRTFNGTGAWRADADADRSAANWSAIPLSQVRVRLPLAR